ncbi:MAG: hypothetical protein HRU19_28195 [Pseudobacteriovorax sp.]|nr:hypothetical protein [Pseudobacteriovorax sp.]
MAIIGLYRPKQQLLGPRISVGQKTPYVPEFASHSQKKLIAFLRHVGCPFAENTIKQLKTWSETHRGVDVFVVSHGSLEATSLWLESIGGLGRLRLIVDEDRRIYGMWGIGYSNLWHFLRPRSLLGVIKLLVQGSRNRRAAGTRWQKAAIFFVDNHQLQWNFIPVSADDFQLPELT